MGNDYYCNTSTGVCYQGECVGAESDPVQPDNCPLIYETCQNAECAATPGCTATNGVCKSGLLDAHDSSICDDTTGLCGPCARTTDAST